MRNRTTSGGVFISRKYAKAEIPSNEVFRRNRRNESGNYRKLRTELEQIKDPVKNGTDENDHSLPSISSHGCPYDNAAMDNFFGTLKTEWPYRMNFSCRLKVEQAVAE